MIKMVLFALVATSLAAFSGDSGCTPTRPPAPDGGSSSSTGTPTPSPTPTPVPAPTPAPPPECVLDDRRKEGVVCTEDSECQTAVLNCGGYLCLNGKCTFGSLLSGADCHPGKPGDKHYSCRDAVPDKPGLECCVKEASQ